ncbi:MAG: serine acetyltransferase [Ignavibacteriales bacterium]|nr:MAG: serine acetyltransferase [Ignavibacteriales bacterium]
MKEIAIYGAGGFGKEVACILNKINEISPVWKLIGYFDDGIAPGEQISHFGKVIGGLNKINAWSSPLNIAFAIGNPQILRKLVSNITNPNISFPNIIHPDVFFADPESFKIGVGNVFVRGCSFSCDVSVGDFNQMNSISSLAHDCKLGSYNVLMPLVRVSGGTEIGDCNFFGINAIILQNVKIGINTKIGAGSMVVRKTKDNSFYIGNPARRVDL